MEKCERCKEGESQAPHSCPFQGDINDDYETFCTCCEECEQQCVDDI